MHYSIQKTSKPRFVMNMGSENASITGLESCFQPNHFKSIALVGSSPALMPYPILFLARISPSCDIATALRPHAAASSTFPLDRGVGDPSCRSLNSYLATTVLGDRPPIPSASAIRLLSPASPSAGVRSALGAVPRTSRRPQRSLYRPAPEPEPDSPSASFWRKRTADGRERRGLLPADLPLRRQRRVRHALGGEDAGPRGICASCAPRPESYRSPCARRVVSDGPLSPAPLQRRRGEQMPACRPAA